MSRQTPHTNPYRKAAGNYAAQGTKEEDTRATEAKALLKAARMLQDLQTSWVDRTPKKIEDTLRYNRQIWVLFYDNAVTQNDAAGAPPRAKGLATNVVNLANFIFKRSMEIMAAPEPEKLNILISINREIASGLMVKTA